MNRSTKSILKPSIYFQFFSGKNQIFSTVFPAIKYRVSIRNISDYSPFGVELQGRTVSSDEYRYGYQGQEKDDEVKGEGNSYSTEFRQYDPRVGRWLSLDPMMREFPGASPYVAYNNNPIYFIDPYGLKGTDWVERGNGKIEWDSNITSEKDSDLKSGEKWLGKNVIVVTHQRIGSGTEVSEPINSAVFEVYLESNKNGPSGKIMGNTVSDDPTKYAVIEGGLYDAKVGHRSKYGASDKAIVINGGGDVPTVNDQGSKGHYANGIFFHKGNNYQKELHDSKGNAYSEGCLLTGCYKNSHDEHDEFYDKSLSDFNGKLYLRAQPVIKVQTAPKESIPKTASPTTKKQDEGFWSWVWEGIKSLDDGSRLGL